MASKTGGLAHGLRQAGLQRGDRIGIYLDASVPQVISIFGVSEAGGVFVPINGTLFPEQVLHVARDCGMKGLITSRKKYESLAEVLPQIPSLEFLVLTDERDAPQPQVRTYRFEEFYGLQPLPQNREESIGKDLAAILYTSGSTG